MLKSIAKKGPKQKNGQTMKKDSTKSTSYSQIAKHDQWLQVPFYENIWDILHATNQGFYHILGDIKKIRMHLTMHITVSQIVV
jgi:hypothetical protein